MVQLTGYWHPQAMGAMQGISAQRALAECSSEATAHGVRVSVTSAFVEVGFFPGHLTPRERGLRF